MTSSVAFHFNVAQRDVHLLRLVRKAWRLGAWVCVSAPARRLDEIDRLLWTFDPLEFIPHRRVADSRRLLTAPDPLPLPVQLSELPAPRRADEVLIHDGGADALGPVAGFEAFDRVIELVGRGEVDRAAARQRWQHYRQAGLTIERHEVPD